MARHLQSRDCRDPGSRSLVGCVSILNIFLASRQASVAYGLLAEPWVDGEGVPGQHRGQQVIAEVERAERAGVAGDAGHPRPVGAEDELTGEPPQAEARVV